MLIDNVTTKVSDTLTDAIQQNDKISVMTGLFSIYTFDHLKDSLNKLDSARLLFSQAKGFDALSITSPFGSLNGSEQENRFRNQLNQKAITKEFSGWLEEKASVRLVKQAGVIHEAYQNQVSMIINLEISHLSQNYIPLIKYKVNDYLMSHSFDQAVNSNQKKPQQN